MGFRQSLTSAEALDTRPGQAAAGVRIDGATATWFDGFGSSAVVDLSTPPGGGTGGSRFLVRGTQRFSDGGASLELSEDELPAGGYQSVATLAADVVRAPNLAMGAWIRGGFANVNGSATLTAGNNLTNLSATVRPSTKSDEQWGSWNSGQGAVGWQHPAPGRYLISGSLALENYGAGPRWEELNIYTPESGWVTVDDDFPAASGYSGVSGFLIADAPEGIKFAFRFTGNGPGAPIIRPNANWSAHRMGSLAV